MSNKKVHGANAPAIRKQLFPFLLPLCLCLWGGLLRASGMPPKVPADWYLSGTGAGAYQAGTDNSVRHNGHRSAFLRAATGKAISTASGFGALMQKLHGAAYAGKQVRLSAFLKTQNVKDHAGLWIKVEEPGEPPASVAKMQEQPVKGTTGWQKCEVVMDIPQDAAGIDFGVLLSGPGTVWINSVRFEEASEASVPGEPTPSHHAVESSANPTVEVQERPRNLNFEN